MAEGWGGEAVPLGYFPHGDVIGRGLGRTIPPQSLLDPAGCAGRRVPAFTQDGRAHFACPMPSLRIAAHEATHVLQQRGFTRDNGLGTEGQAAAVESRIWRGADAAGLLGDRGRAPAPGPHHYTFIDKSTQAPGNWDAKMHLRVSDDGRMAVGGSKTGHDFWATAAKIEESNAILAKLGHEGSAIRLLKQAETLSGPAPDGGGAHILSKVTPSNVYQEDGGEMTLWADCGAAARDVMGAGQNSVNRSGKVKGVYYAPALAGAAPGSALRGPERLTQTYDPERMKKEILGKQFGKAPAAAHALYLALGDSEREAVDRQADINEYAEPQTGEGYTMSTGPKQAEGLWDFHFAAVIMVSGDDRTTLENYSVSIDEAKNRNWVFAMYGSAAKPNQTFHEQHQATGLHGQSPITMRIRTIR
ncbi:MAG TPA: hypothetical protein VN231_06185 [Allosphingosinicella sp.]|nr:hypothetical protein [Allosphingosinicella sp.]